MAHRAMNSLVEPELIWGPLSETASRIGREGSSRLRSTVPSARASISRRSPSASSASTRATWTWVEVSSEETTVVSHFLVTRVHDRHGRGLPTALEVGRVVNPDRVLLVRGPLGKGLPGRGPDAPRPAQVQPVSSQNALDGGRRHPHPAEVGAAVGELAMRAVELAPLVGQLEDRAISSGLERVHRRAARL